MVSPDPMKPPPSSHLLALPFHVIAQESAAGLYGSAVRPQDICAALVGIVRVSSRKVYIIGHTLLLAVDKGCLVVDRAYHLDRLRIRRYLDDIAVGERDVIRTSLSTLAISCDQSDGNPAFRLHSPELFQKRLSSDRFPCLLSSLHQTLKQFLSQQSPTLKSSLWSLSIISSICCCWSSLTLSLVNTAPLR